MISQIFNAEFIIVNAKFIISILKNKISHLNYLPLPPVLQPDHLSHKYDQIQSKTGPNSVRNRSEISDFLAEMLDITAL